jgi:hypothetical protein
MDDLPRCDGDDGHAARIDVFVAEEAEPILASRVGGTRKRDENADLLAFAPRDFVAALRAFSRQVRMCDGRTVWSLCAH